MATYDASDDLTVYGGWTLGWDTGFEDNMGGNTFIGGFSYAVSEDIGLTYITTVGDLGARGGDAYTHSIVADVTLTDNLNYVFQSDYVRVEETQDDDVGINQYLFYTVNDCLALGGRFEWWKNEGQSQYEATVGLNYRANANITVRPEIRHDFAPFASTEQTTFGVDAILTF